MRLSPKFVGSLLATRKRSLWCLAILVFLFSGYALAQDATIVGTVTDPSGAAIPNASVTITNVDTGRVQQMKTNTDGQYLAPELHIGNYTVRAEASGFKAAERKDLKLQLGDRTRIDFQMQMGTAQETISVEAAAVAVQSENGEVSSMITGQQVTQLATNGRTMYTLALLTPGASSGQPDFQIPTPVAGNGTISFNGQRNSHNLYLLDGAESADRGGGGNSDVMPSIDSLAEFRTLTSNYGAEYGLSSAGTITAVIKSGTKTLHASAWEFTRNDALDARNYFNPAPNKVAALRFHTYGFNAGGPIDFWKKEHKSFFFYNMEWRSLIQGGLTNQLVPFGDQYLGDFTTHLPADFKDPRDDSGATLVPHSGLHTPCAFQLSAAQQALFAGQTFSTPVTINGSPVCSIPSKADALAHGLPTFQPFVGNALPFLDNNAQLLLAAGIFPKPTTADGHFVGGNNSPTKVREEIVRIDHSFNSKVSVFGHFVAEQISQTFGTTMWSGGNIPTIGNTFGNPSYSGVVHVVHTISPTLLNEVAFNYNGNRINIVPVGVIARPSGFDVPRLFTGPNSLERIPQIALGGPVGAQYTAASWPWHNKADDYQIRDDISWTRGAHQFKIGASWAIYKKVQDLFGNTQGAFQFNNTYTGNDFADFLLGYADSYGELGVQDHGFWNNVSYALYFQDNWRATRRLTLNLGLRWDGVPHTYEANDRMGNFYSGLYDKNAEPTFNADGTISTSSLGLGTSPNPILAGYQFYLNGIGMPGKGGIPKGLVDNHWAAFGPRLGFAYDVTGSGKTVVRGGVGVMYERIQGNDMYNAGPNIPFSTNVNLNNVLFSLPTTQIGGTGAVIDPKAEVTIASIQGLDRAHYKLPVSVQFSAGVQRALSEKTVLSVAYVGTQTRHQNTYQEVNLPDPALLADITNGNIPYDTNVPFLGYHSLRMAENVQNGSYNSLQMELRSQMTKALTLQAGYTLSKAIDPSDGGSGMDLGNMSDPYNPKYNANRPSALDRRNILFVDFVYDLPFFNHSDSKALKTALGGWQVSGVVDMESGTPLNINLGGSFTNVSNKLPNSNNRPDVTGKIGTPNKVNEWFDTTVFTVPTAGTFGNTPFNAVYGPGRQNWNLSLFKSFLFSESRGSRLEFRAEAFNVWNHTQFLNVSSGMSNGDFGKITSAHDPRELQLGIKLYF